MSVLSELVQNPEFWITNVAVAVVVNVFSTVLCSHTSFVLRGLVCLPAFGLLGMVVGGRFWFSPHVWADAVGVLGISTLLAVMAMFGTTRHVLSLVVPPIAIAALISIFGWSSIVQASVGDLGLAFLLIWFNCGLVALLVHQGSFSATLCAKLDRVDARLSEQ